MITMPRIAICTKYLENADATVDTTPRSINK